jgi:hypothetical protein
VTQQDVVYRRYLNPLHRSYIPDFGVYIKVQGAGADLEYRTISRQLVLFCVERRKAWRMLQSKAGIENKEYKAQRSILADLDAGKISNEDFFARAEELMRERTSGPAPAPAPAPALAAPVPVPASAEHKPPVGTAKQSRSGSPQNLQEPRVWKESNMSDSADDVIDLGICPICEKTLKLAYPDAADVNGLIVHTTCVAKAVEQPVKQQLL